MKKLLLTLTVCISLASVSVYASFPVNTAKKTDKTEVKASDKVSTTNVSTTETKAEFKELKKATKELNKTAAPDNEMWITLALWFFLGAFAAHRWYKKKPVGANILFILTAGGCGVWAIIDLIKILQGDF